MASCLQSFQFWLRNGRASTDAAAREIPQGENALGAAFPKPMGTGSAVAPGFRPPILRDMQMPEGRDSRWCRETVSGHLRAIRYRAGARRRRRRSGRRRGTRYERVRARPARFGLRADGGVVAADAIDEVRSLSGTSLT